MGRVIIALDFPRGDEALNLVDNLEKQVRSTKSVFSSIRQKARVWFEH